MDNLSEIRSAASEGNIEVIQALIDSQPDKENTKVLSVASKALAAAKKIDQLHTLIMQNPTVGLSYLQQAFFEAFKVLADKGNLHEMRLLATKPMPGGTDIAWLLNLGYPGPTLFNTAALKGDLEMMTELNRYIPNDRRDKHTAYYGPFCDEAKNGNEVVIKRIIDLAQDDRVVRDMCWLNNYIALRMAVKSGNENDMFLMLFLTPFKIAEHDEMLAILAKPYLKGPELERITRLLAEIKTAAQAPTSSSIFRNNDRAAAADDLVSQDPNPKSS